MAIIHGGSGSLSDLLEKLDDKRLSSVKDIVEFSNTVKEQKDKALTEAKHNVDQEILAMKADVQALTHSLDQIEATIHSGRILGKIGGRLRRFQMTSQLSSLKDKLASSETHIENLVRARAGQELNRLERLDGLLREYKHLIFGAMGEERVIASLLQLPASYEVINDFRREFDRPIYNRNDGTYIKSIQIDHLVIGPTGLFIIETKNWSKESIERDDFYSPVQQIKRAGYAMFVVLNSAVGNGLINGMVNRWGERKISPKQVVVSINPVPKVAYQYVKVLSLDELVKYILSGEVVFHAADISAITSYLRN